MLLSIDPGLRACGCALFLDVGTLHSAALVKGAAKGLSGPQAWRATAQAVRNYVGSWCITRVLFERMPAYGSDLPSRTLKLHDLTAVCAWICALYPDAEPTGYYPREWEGTLNRKGAVDPIVERIKGRLTVSERARVELPAPSLAHNTWDSVGIGLKALGRFELHREIRRE